MVLHPIPEAMRKFLDSPATPVGEWGEMKREMLDAFGDVPDA